MRFSAAAVAAPLALAGLAASTPVPAKRNLEARYTNDNYSDATILNYALTLEYLERTFYQQSLNKYDASTFKNAGYAAYVRERFTEIAYEEAVHVNFLSTALKAAGATPVEQCTYDFGVDSVESFRDTAEIFEGIGVAAYLGAAPSITNKAYLAVAGSILVVEAEHETWIRSAVDTEDPFPRPFFAPLDFNQVYTLVAPFIKSCPSSSPSLPFHTFPSVTIAPEPYYKPGCELTVTSSSSGAKYAAFVSAVGTKFVPFTSGQKVTIPEGILGQSFLILTNTNTSVADSATVAGPAMIFVENEAMNYEYNNPTYPSY